ncbi:MAG TPA: type VI secretion system tip protein VgrG [Bacteroidia bacterium]|jgi:Rhs element Vgr protein|nr:type VI secretion system tip protein VgrG [Bacteroidia bacterium]
MATATPIPATNLANPTFKVIIGGMDIASKYGVASIMVSKRVNRIPVAEIVLYDGSTSDKKFELSEIADFKPGTEVTIKAGDENPKKIFTGIITRQSIKGGIQGNSTLTIEMRDKCVKMTINRKNKYFKEALDSAIISKIASENGVSGTVDPTTVTHTEETVQYYCTDWDFVVSRAEANGMLVFAEDGKLNVKKPVFTVLPTSPTLTYGDNIVDFEAELDVRDDFGGVTAKDWDYSKQQVIEKKGKKPTARQEGNLTEQTESGVLGISDYHLQHAGKLLDGELEAWATAKFLRSEMSKIQGRARINGTFDVKPGDMATLAGAGKTFNGPAFVSGVTQSYSSNSTWYTDIHFGYDQEWFYEKYENINDKPAAGLLPAVNGLVAGIVTDIVDQQGGEFRVRVRIPLIDNGDKGVWARIVSADAGSARGILIRPEKDDEVILGFVNDDPRDPVILGMLYSKKNKVAQKLTPSADNKMKGWITKGGAEITINDKDQIIKVITKGKNSITIDDKKKSITLEDQNKNKLVMDDKGFLLDTPKDINLKAKGKINIEGTNNVTVKSNAQLKATGTSGAEMSSSGQTVVKGSLLKLN